MHLATPRYYRLHDDGKIALGEYIESADLDEAIDQAYAVAREHPPGALHYVEVWREADRLYSSPRAGTKQRGSDVNSACASIHIKAR